MKLSHFYNEITASLSKYDDLGLVDKRTLKMNVMNELKRFGNNIMEDRSTIIEVAKNTASLPDGFWRLKAAVKYSKIDEREAIEPKFRADYEYTQRLEETMEWDNESYSHYMGSFKRITEKKQIRGTERFITYTPIEMLHINAGTLNKDTALATDCINKKIKNNLGNSITINNLTVYSSFKTGFIYINYDSLPEDEDGDLIIPEDRPNLLRYIKSYAIYRTLEDIWLKENYPELKDQLMYFKTEADRTFPIAQTESKMNRLTVGWDVRFKNKNRKAWTR